MKLSKNFFAKKYLGYTLIELIIVMVLIGIITAISVPSYRAFKVSSQLNYAAEKIITEWQSLISCARSTSILGSDGKNTGIQLILNEGDNFITKKIANNPDANEYCSDTKSDGEKISLGEEIKISAIESSDSSPSLLEIKFLPPYGHLDPGTGEIKITLELGSKTRILTGFLKSGLITAGQ